MGLLSVTEAAAVFGQTSGTGELFDPDIVQPYLDAVTEIIEELSQPVDMIDRVIRRDGGGEAVLTPWPFSAIVEIVESGRTLTDADYVPDETAGIIYRGTTTATRNWSPGRLNIQVTASVGASVIPGGQKLAAQEFFRHLWTIRQGPRPSFVNSAGDTVLTPSGYAIPNRVAELLIATPPLPGFA